MPPVDVSSNQTATSRADVSADIHTLCRRVLHIQSMYINYQKTSSTRANERARERKPRSEYSPFSPLKCNSFSYPSRNSTLPNELTARRHDASRLQGLWVSTREIVDRAWLLSVAINDSQLIIFRVTAAVAALAASTLLPSNASFLSSFRFFSHPSFRLLLASFLSSRSFAGVVRDRL
jgi:hypothetical protein